MQLWPHWCSQRICFICSVQRGLTTRDFIQLSGETFFSANLKKTNPIAHCMLFKKRKCNARLIGGIIEWENGKSRRKCQKARQISYSDKKTDLLSGTLKKLIAISNYHGETSYILFLFVDKGYYALRRWAQNCVLNCTA